MTTQTYDLYSDAFRKHTHHIYASMRAEAPVFQQAGLDGQTPIWFVTGAAEVEQVLLDSQTFARDPALVPGAHARRGGAPALRQGSTAPQVQRQAESR